MDPNKNKSDKATGTSLFESHTETLMSEHMVCKECYKSINYKCNKDNCKQTDLKDDLNLEIGTEKFKIEIKESAKSIAIDKINETKQDIDIRAESIKIQLEKARKELHENLIKMTKLRKVYMYEFVESLKIGKIITKKRLRFYQTNLKMYHYFGEIDEIDTKSTFSKAKHIASLNDHMKPVTCLLELKNGKMISGCADSGIRIFNLKKNTCIQTLNNISPVTSMALLQNGNLVAGSIDKTITVWNIEKKTILRSLVEPLSKINSMCQIKSGEILSASADGAVRVYKNEICTDEFNLFMGGVVSMIELKSGEIITGTWVGVLNIWDICSKRLQARLIGHSGDILSLVELKNGDVVSGSVDKSIKIWCMKTKTCLKTLTGHTEPISSMIELKNGELLSASMDNTMKVWDIIKNKTCIATINLKDCYATCLFELRNGKLIFGDSKHKLQIWKRN